jgi:adenosylhomocysteine nucleosidase
VITGIVVALPEELSTLTAKKIAKGCVEQISDNILVIFSGAGRENARTAAQLLVTLGASKLISWGCAAALDASFRPGDLVLANRCVDAEHNEFDLKNEEWLIHAKSCLSECLMVRMYMGKLAESAAIVETSHDKAGIAAAMGAIALDMESVAIAKVAQGQGLLYLSVRAIADPLNMDLPKAVSHALNDQGDVVIGKLLAYLVCHPSELPGLIRLGLSFHAAKTTLKHVARALDEIARFNIQTEAPTQQAG